MPQPTPGAKQAQFEIDHIPRVLQSADGIMRMPPLIEWLPTFAALCLLTHGCGVSDGPRELAEATTKLKNSWKLQAEKHREPDYKGMFYYHQIFILKDLLKQTPTKVVEAEFQRICSIQVPQVFTHDYYDLDKNYDTVLLQALVQRSIERKDTRRVTELLSHNCPRYIAYCPLEYSLANDWPGSIERLFECYAAAKSPVAKRDITFCLGRAFPSLRARSPADDAFIQQAASWYRENRSKLQVNSKYEYLPAQPPPRSGEDSKNLFVFR